MHREQLGRVLRIAYNHQRASTSQDWAARQAALGENAGDLMLESVITKARQNEEVKCQQVTLRGETWLDASDSKYVDRVFKDFSKGKKLKTGFSSTTACKLCCTEP